MTDLVTRLPHASESFKKLNAAYYAQGLAKAKAAAVEKADRALVGKVSGKLGEGVFAAFCEQLGIPPCESEYRFHPERRWRFDYAWPDRKLALEVEGGVWTEGRHTRGKGFIADMEKYNAAALLGWSVLRVVPDNLMADSTVEMLRKVFA